MTREELEASKYPLSEIKDNISAAEEQIGKVGCTHKTNIARAKIEYNRLVNEEFERNRSKTLVI